MSTLSYGSQGSEVEELQKLLNSTGRYSLKTDGIFGSNTKAAVTDYQKQNGLTIDGIAGSQTWGSLTSANTAAQAARTAASSVGDRPVYTQSQAVLDAAARLAEAQGNEPAEYTSQYGGQIQSILDGLLNRPDFRYDVSEDSLYTQYSDMFQQSGQRAMKDAMGQAAALTGGYGNSWAQTVGQQAYQNQLQGMNDVIPELQQAAYNMYSQEGADMQNDLALLQGMESDAYGKYRDTVGDYNTERASLQSLYDSEYGRDYGQYQDRLNQYNADRAYAYQQAQDAVANSQWQQEFNLASSRRSSGGGSSKSVSALDWIDSLDVSDDEKTQIANVIYGVEDEEEKKKAAYKAWAQKLTVEPD